MSRVAPALRALPSDVVPRARAVPSVAAAPLLLALVPDAAQQEPWMAPARLLREASADALVVELAPQQDAVASSERSALQALRALQTAVARPVARPLAVPTSARPAGVEGEAALQVGQP